MDISPPLFNQLELQGASRTTGGIFRGRAYGNNPNIGDFADEDDNLIPAFQNCESDLLNARGGSFCAIHERAYGSKCRVIGCSNDKVHLTQACQQHKSEWNKHTHNRSPGALAGVRRVLRRPAENLEWLPNLQRNPLPHDGPVPPDRENKNYFSPNRFYCVETICAPCGTVIAWTKFAKSESPTKIMNFLSSIYPTRES